jgi:hypothetical protein
MRMYMAEIVVTCAGPLEGRRTGQQPGRLGGAVWVIPVQDGPLW